MAKLIKGLTKLIAETITHEGAAAYDLSISDPIMHLAFTKSSTMFTDTFYHTQETDLFEYSRALLQAEKSEAGFAWRFAAYMRDPKEGKGNRIQGTVAPAILAAAYPESGFVREYVFKCLRHRADDLVRFMIHFVNLCLGEVPEEARKGMADAANNFDEYQLLKYAGKRYPILRRRKNGRRATLRLADALGLVKEYLNEEKLEIYEYLHAPTRKKDELAGRLKLASRRRRFFKTGNLDDALAGRLSLEQLMSSRNLNKRDWNRLLQEERIVPDIAFKQYVRTLYQFGIGPKRLEEEARNRLFKGLWPHQVYAGYRAITQGITRYRPGKEGKRNRRSIIAFSRSPVPVLTEVFEQILESSYRSIAEQFQENLALGIADVSPSMYGVPLGGEHSSVRAGHAALVLAAMMSKDLGYVATFDDSIQILHRPAEIGNLRFADLLLKDGKGWGGTQVHGSILALIQILKANKKMKRPETLIFFSDMQFHPPEAHGEYRIFGNEGTTFGFSRPPLVSALETYENELGPVDVVLWNLASYNASPMPSRLKNVLMLSGFDANSMKYIQDWKRARKGTEPGRSVEKREKMSQDFAEKHVVLDRIRSF